MRDYDSWGSTPGNFVKISFGSWAFTFGPRARRALGFAESAKLIAAAGYDGIEISGFPPHVTLDQYRSSQSRQELVRMLGDLGLGVSAYVPDFTRVNPLIEANRQRYLDAMSAHVELSAELGGPALRVDPVVAPGCISDQECEAAADQLARIWSEAADIAARSKVRLLWEFEPGFAFNKPSEVVSLYEQVGHSNFQILFDTAHAYLCAVVGARQQGERQTLAGGVEGLLELLAGRIGHIHLVDTDGTLYGDETSTHCNFGEGVIPFDTLAPKLRAVPGIQWWCVDMSFHAEAERVLSSSLAFARRLLR
ncbi:MAG: sugar phosphate isomerase/epimerase [Acidobacteria bacterium]|nr:sugar phosphate isomerase/epimerase [Acidobacteriota bacterium]